MLNNVWNTNKVSILLQPYLFGRANLPAALFRMNLDQLIFIRFYNYSIYICNIILMWRYVCTEVRTNQRTGTTQQWHRSKHSILHLTVILHKIPRAASVHRALYHLQMNCRATRFKPNVWQKEEEQRHQDWKITSCTDRVASLVKLCFAQTNEYSALGR